MLSRLYNTLRQIREDEEGFTVLELLIVVAVIGLLSLTAIPIFMNQREASAQAAVKSELRNAAIVMEQSLIKNNNRYLSYLPNYIPTTTGVEVRVDKDKSNPQKFCLVGQSSTHTTVKYSYDSSMGGLLAPIQVCSAPTNGPSFKTQNLNKKVLLVYTYNDSDITTYTNYFKSIGYPVVDYKPNPSILEYKNYDIIVAVSNAWTMPSSVYVNLQAGYNQGHKIFTDGNDNGSIQIPILAAQSVTSGASVGGKKVELNRTGNEMNPPFPYTFPNSSFSSDSSWQCITKAQPGVVVITDTPNPSSSAAATCLTGLAASNAAGGKWVHFSMANREVGGASESAMEWLGL